MIISGRAGADKGIGKFTFHNHRGSSVNDYAACTKNVLDIIDDFSVSNPNEFSDHSSICLTLKCNNLCSPSDNNININSCNNMKMSWKEEKKDDFCKEMNSDESFNEFSTIISILEKEVASENIINTCVNRIQNVLLNAARSHSTKTQGRSRVSSKSVNSDYNGWYDEDCKRKRLEFKTAEREYRLIRGDNERLKMCKARKSYRKLCRLKRREFQVSKAEELVTLSKKNPRLFWNKIKKGKKKNNATCNFYDYFKELNNIEPRVSDFVQEKIENWEASEDCLCNESLDSIITIDELENALKKLKMNKSSGLDNILNVFLVFGGSQLKCVLLKLFNVILETGIFPAVWASGEIVPVFKSGDPNIPSNYRGITLVSCLGKLFTNIINVRLNEWAEENNIYSETQYGFRNNRNTSDCLFVLHGLIQHFITNKSPFLCFY